ncbi:hypothetical protein Tco_0932488, partial [Tanacetum coccineum]
MKTPMFFNTKLTKDEECDSIDSTKYRGMIEAPKTSHLEAVKRIFRYIKGNTHLGLWYPKGTDIETVVYADSDHAGDYVDRKSTSGNHAFFVEFECLLEISDQICPRFILEFYSQYQINYSDEGEMFIEFVIQTQFFSYSLKEFAQILDIPCEGVCVFTDKWSLDELAYGVPTNGPYQTNPSSPDDIISSIRIDSEGQVCRIRHEEEIDVLENQVLTREIEPTMKPLKEIIRENIFYLGNENPELNNESYVLYDRVMNPLVAQKERKPRNDRGKRRGRHFTSSSFAFDQPSSSHLNDDDDGNGKGTSCASTASPICYVNSLNNQVP